MPLHEIVELAHQWRRKQKDFGTKSVGFRAVLSFVDLAIEECWTFYPPIEPYTQHTEGCLPVDNAEVKSKCCPNGQQEE